MCPKRVCISTVGVRKDLYPKDPNDVRITDFFGSIRPTEICTQRVNVTLASNPEDDVETETIAAVSADTKKYVFYEQFPIELFE